MNVLRLSIPPLPRFAKTARHAFSEFAGLHCLARPDAEYIVFALGEAVANAIQHAATGEDIEVRIRLEGDAIVATIRDCGRGFPVPPRGPRALPSAFAESGRGFAIMQRCTDFLEVNSRPGKGTVVTMVRYCRPHQELAPVS
jgi:serine/threonine-protein kinase RsbW